MGWVGLGVGGLRLGGLRLVVVVVIGGGYVGCREMRFGAEDGVEAEFKPRGGTWETERRGRGIPRRYDDRLHERRVEHGSSHGRLPATPATGRTKSHLLSGASADDSNDPDAYRYITTSSQHPAR